MLSKGFAGSGKPYRNVVPALVKQRGKFFNRIGMPIASDKHDPALLIQGLKKTINDAGSFFCHYLILNGERCGYKLCNFFQGNIIMAVPFLCGVLMISLESKVPNDSANIAQKGIGSLRRYGVPDPKIGIVYTFFGIKPVVQYVIGDLAANSSVFV